MMTAGRYAPTGPAHWEVFYGTLDKFPNTTPIPAPPYYQQLATAFNARTTQAMYSGSAKSALDGLQSDLEAFASPPDLTSVATEGLQLFAGKGIAEPLNSYVMSDKASLQGFSSDVHPVRPHRSGRARSGMRVRLRATGSNGRNEAALPEGGPPPGQAGRARLAARPRLVTLDRQRDRAQTAKAWGPEPEPSLADQVAEQAELIVNNLLQTDYQYTENIDVDNGVYDCDCSQFTNFVLSRAAPDHYATLVAAAGEPVPRAFDYYDFLSSLLPQAGDGWEQVEVLADAARGDLIAWRFPQIEPGHDTGHVVFVADMPAVDDQGYFAVRVYDSAIVPNFDDTRGDGPGQWPSGVGSGFINFQVDDDGQPVAFQFSPPLSSEFTALPIAIGRLA